MVGMPPKAKAKAKPKAKAAGHPMHRPAARVRAGRLRRPARRAGGEVSPWDAGLEVDLWKVSPLELRPGTSLVITKGDYYGAEARLAGEIVKYEMSHEGNTMIIKPTGTDHEGI